MSKITRAERKPGYNTTRLLDALDAAEGLRALAAAIESDSTLESVLRDLARSRLAAYDAVVEEIAAALRAQESTKETT